MKEYAGVHSGTGLNNSSVNFSNPWTSTSQPHQVGELQTDPTSAKFAQITGIGPIAPRVQQPLLMF